MNLLVDRLERVLPFTSAMVFLAVARQGNCGLDQGRMRDELEMTSGTASRAVRSLGTGGGRGLVERWFNKFDNRKRVLRLTPKGRRLLARTRRALRAEDMKL